MTYPGDMTDNNAARAMAARLRAAPDDTYTNAALTELLHQAADLIDDLIGDEYNGPTELHPLTNGTVTVTIDPSHPMAQPLFTGGKATDLGRALLPERFIAQLEAMLNDDQELVLDRTPLLQPATEVDLPDLAWPTAEQILSGNSYFTINREDGSMEQLDPTTVRRHPEGYYIAEPPGPIEPGRG